MADRRWSASLLVALLLITVPLDAQAPDTLRLSLSQAVARAVTQSEEVLTARAQRDITESQIVQVRAGALPQVNALLTYNRTLASIFEGITLFPPEAEEPNGENPFADLPFGQPNTWVATLQLSQPIYSAGRVSTGLEIARHARRAADMDVLEAEAEITLQVRNSYFRAVLAEAMISIASEAFQLADAQLRQVELFRQQGTVADFDVLVASVERDNLQPGIIEARNARRLAELNLKRLINVPMEQPIVLVTPLEPAFAELDRAALRSALEERAALRAIDAMIAARRGAVRYARSDRLPTISGNANFSYQAFPSQFSPLDADWRRDWTVGFSASVPIFQGFRTRGAIRQAEAELRQVQLQRALTQQALEVELEAAIGEFEAARAQIEARRATVGQARRALELAELRYRNGLATQLHVSNTRLLLEQARVNETQGLFNYVHALTRLERATGGTIPMMGALLPVNDER
jgi:outer membrane protein